MQNEKLYQIALTQLPNIGYVLSRNLLGYFGSSVEVFNASKKDLLKVPGIGEKLVAEVINNKDNALQIAEKELKYIDKEGIDLHFFTDDTFSKRLKNCPDAPLCLYSKGNFSMNAKRTIGIVGTRSATEYGRLFTQDLVASLAKLDVQVISGLAFGIDIAAHKASVLHDISTIGVLAHGLHTIYPPVHSKTAVAMQNNGGIITEYISGTKPDRENFPMRNRILAGMCDGVLVVEASEKGGALITAHLAFGYDRDVFTLPGRISDTYSAGCNKLIQQNIAQIITQPKDLITAMAWEDFTTTEQPKQQRLLLNLTETEKDITDLLMEGQQSIDDIALHLSMPMSKVSATLLGLEMQNIIRVLPGKMYELN